MDARVQIVQSALCPNCGMRVPDTRVTYEHSPMSGTPARHGGRRWRRNAVKYGSATLCAVCAAAYYRCLELRTTGRRLLNIGLLLMLLSGALYTFGLTASLQRSASGMALISLFLLGAMVTLAGTGVYLSGRVLQRSAARFIATLH
jgi:hypothetical protein